MFYSLWVIHEALKMGSMNKEEIPTDNPQEKVREDTEAETISLTELHGNLTHFATGAQERMYQSEIQQQR